MADNKPLYEYIGDPNVLIGPIALSTSAIVADSTTVGVPVSGYDGVLFLEILAATDTSDVHQFQIQYSSTGNASDAVTSNATMTCTDAIWGVHPAAEPNQISILDFSIKDKDIDGGALFVSAAAAENTSGAVIGCIIGIPYGGTTIYPATNAITAVHAQSRS